MKVLLIGNTLCHAATRLAEEFGAAQIEFRTLTPKDLHVSVIDGYVHLTDRDGEDLLTYDVFMFRGIGVRTAELAVLARYLQEHGKMVCEHIFARRSVHIGKFAPTMIENHVPVPNYHLIFSKNDNLFSSIEYPLILKGLDGSKGNKVGYVENKEKLLELLEDTEKFGYPIILQKYIPIKYDFRVLVVGGKVLGVMKRYNSGDDFLTIRAGGKRESVELPQEALDIAVHAAKVAQLDIAGVDLVEYEGKYFRLEVNMSPQFRVFEEVTGVNVAGEIVQYIVGKHEKSKKVIGTSSAS